VPKIAYIEKRFRTGSLTLIDLVNQVVDEYQRQGYNLTLRQVYYQMVARDIIENNLRSYKNLGNLINEGRLAGLIDWYAIEDRTRNLLQLSHWHTPAEIIDSAAQSYHRNWWEGQDYYVEVWVEKDALVDVVGQSCDRHDIPYFSCRGYVSQSELWGAARRLKAVESYGRRPVVLHLGDHDPSGIDMSRDITDRLQLFGVANLTFRRIALNMDQIDNYVPPPNPTKLTDSRSAGYIEKYGYECWELDALEPSVIDGLIGSHVSEFVNTGLIEEAKTRERRERDQLVQLSSSYSILEANWGDIASKYCLEA
jgi:hypothetical protein